MFAPELAKVRTHTVEKHEQRHNPHIHLHQHSLPLLCRIFIADIVEAHVVTRAFESGSLKTGGPWKALHSRRCGRPIRLDSTPEEDHEMPKLRHWLQVLSENVGGVYLVGNLAQLKLPATEPLLHPQTVALEMPELIQALAATDADCCLAIGPNT